MQQTFLQNSTTPLTVSGKSPEQDNAQSPEQIVRSRVNLLESSIIKISGAVSALGELGNEPDHFRRSKVIDRYYAEDVAVLGPETATSSA